MTYLDHNSLKSSNLIGLHLESNLVKLLFIIHLLLVHSWNSEKILLFYWFFPKNDVFVFALYKKKFLHDFYFLKRLPKQRLPLTELKNSKDCLKHVLQRGCSKVVLTSHPLYSLFSQIEDCHFYQFIFVKFFGVILCPEGTTYMFE